MVIDENGMEIEELQHDNALRIKLQSISSLINQVEETQAEIGRFTNESRIWETFIESGNHHYRCTTIMKFQKIRGVNKSYKIGTRSLD
jgi:hypothetical protein